ncbi:hypothetical protein [Ferdinandcohnia sp. Marseille-Q9671]
MATLRKNEIEYVDKVIKELKKHKINRNNLESIKEQLTDHILTSQQNGEDSIEQLGDSDSIVNDYLELYSIDTQQSKSPKSTYLPVAFGVIAFLFVYLLSQVLLSLFLTESFSDNRNFDYNILYHIDVNPWWNTLLVMISFFTALILSILVSFLLRSRFTR